MEVRLEVEKLIERLARARRTKWRQQDRALAKACRGQSTRGSRCAHQSALARGLKYGRHTAVGTKDGRGWD